MTCACVAPGGVCIKSENIILILKSELCCHIDGGLWFFWFLKHSLQYVHTSPLDWLLQPGFILRDERRRD